MLYFWSHNWLLYRFQDKYKRALADTENLRTRSQKMVEDAKLYGKDYIFFFSYVKHFTKWLCHKKYKK